MTRTSAGFLLHRHGEQGCEVLLGHMGGPAWRRRPRGWTIPKGEVAPGEDPYLAALRELQEEVGLALAPDAGDVALGEVVQKAGKRVLAWTRSADVDLAALPAPVHDVEMEWPPRSGRRVTFPELDEVRWWPVDAALDVVVEAQQALLRRLQAECAAGALG